MNRIRQLVRIAGVFTQKGGIRAVLRWKPFSITAFRMLRQLKREGLSFKLIIDGGANKGQFARAACETFPDASIIAFEPLPDVADRLRSNLADRPQVSVVQSALGSMGGYLSFYRHPYSLASSALPLAMSQENSGIDLIQVPVSRLDDIIAKPITQHPVLLKLDLQGYEIEALKGASDVLLQIDYVLLEASFSTTYTGEPDFSEILDFMQNAGFRFLRPLDLLRDEYDSVTQIDALFINRNVRGD